jgi:hypothetical protein
MMSVAKRSGEILMNSISTPPAYTNDTLSPSQKAVHSRSTSIIFEWIFKYLRRFLQETGARHRSLDAIHTAAVLDPDIPGKFKSLAKRILVSIGHRLDSLVEGPSVQALFTRALSVCGLRNM